ncbi:hypothetical protein GWC95_13410 [Sediminibacterium roseum]|uniref:GLPGLI family protein n=1 Tax=Sediminibacterium roseum TaxID=1978412 RepID=A0ABW9ZWL8_9BACT|nr:hypothetical protein [Sediminibacterium roseum]NCI50925.1 hypothetical protein [Sediminibacterium roseum]
MRQIFTLTIALFCLTNSIAQKSAVTSKILTSKEIREVFNETILKTLNITFPIFRIYKYTDKSGEYYCILAESTDQITNEKDTLHHKIKSVNVKPVSGSFTKTWEINDNVIKNDNDENSIRFWTKYIDFRDYDGDGLVDPIIIYGTLAANGYDDGRIKFIIYYRGEKIAIRHQNGVLDFERETQVDKAFYELPQSLQINVKQKMELMMKNEHAIFPAGWQIAMKNKKTIFNERR